MAEVDAQPASSSNTFGIQPVSGSLTPFQIHEQGISKEIDEFSFRKILLNIDKNLMKEDILALKYLCLDKNIGLRHGELENVNRGLDLLEKLERRGFLSKSKLEVLFELLGLIERFDLQREVEKCLDLQQKMRGIQAKNISTYRAMILDFASDIGRKELKSLKPILKPYITARTIEGLNEPIELMIELEKLKVISPQKVTFLFQVADYLQSEDLVHKLMEFKDNYISHVAESLGEEWRMLGFALELSSRDMDGIHDAQGMIQKFLERTKEDQFEKLCSGLRSRLVGRNDIADLLEKDIYIQPKSHGDSESVSPVAEVSDCPAQPENHGDTEQISLIQNGSTQDIYIQPKRHGDSESVSPVADVSDSPAQPENHGDTEQISLIQNGSTQDAIQRDTESLSSVTDVSEGSIHPNNHRDTEPPVATIATTRPENKGSRESSIREKCWCMAKWIFLIVGGGGIVLSIILGVMSVLLENDLGKKISAITGEIATTVTIIGFIMLIYDKCKASNCCPRNRKETQSQPRQFTGTFKRVGSDLELKINIPQ